MPRVFTKSRLWLYIKVELCSFDFHVRQVSKVLSPNSLIAKIWLAWGEEQQNVLFTVKRIKTERREAGQEGGENQPAVLQSGQECPRPRKSVKRRNSKATTGKQPVDTVHPR